MSVEKIQNILNSKFIDNLIYKSKTSFAGREYLCQICREKFTGDLQLLYHDGRMEHKSAKIGTEMLNTDTDTHSFRPVDCMLKNMKTDSIFHF